MLKNILLWVAVLSLLLGLWAAWSHFQGWLDRPAFLQHILAVTAIWFVSATWWAYVKDGPRTR